MYDLRDLVPLGSAAKVSRTVKESDTATNYSPDLNTLLAPPACIDMAIQACVAAIDTLLPDGFVSVSRNIEFEHMASTLLGVKVTMSAEVVEVQPTYIMVRLTLTDDIGEIGRGMNRRSIVKSEALMDRANRRVQMMTNERNM